MIFWAPSNSVYVWKCLRNFTSLLKKIIHSFFNFGRTEIIKDWTYDGYSYVSLEQDLTHGVKTPHFYHELVYQLIYFTLTDGSQKCIDAAVETLEYLKKKGLLTDEQTKTGFLRIYKEMDELTLDVPSVSIISFWPFFE